MMMALSFTAMIYFAYQVIPNWRDLVQQFGGAFQPGNEEVVIDSHAYLGLLRMFVYPVLLPLSLVFGYDLVAADLRRLEGRTAQPLIVWANEDGVCSRRGTSRRARSCFACPSAPR